MLAYTEEFRKSCACLEQDESSEKTLKYPKLLLTDLWAQYKQEVKAKACF